MYVEEETGMGLSTSPTKILALLGVISPQAWDAIIPHNHGWLNRSPEPQQLAPPDAFIVGAAQMTREVTRIAVEAEVRGQSSPAMLQEWVGEWCGTPWPRKWPWPGPHPDPDPDPWMIGAGRIVGALVLTSVAARLGETELATALLEGADALTEAAVKGIK